MGKGIHVTLGPGHHPLPATSTPATGPFHTLATFTQTKPSTHRRGLRAVLRRPGARRRRPEVHLLPDPPGRDVPGQAARGREDHRRHQGLGGVRRGEEARRPGLGHQPAGGRRQEDPSKVVFKVNGEPVYTLDAKASDGTAGGASGEPQPRRAHRRVRRAPLSLPGPLPLRLEHAVGGVAHDALGVARQPLEGRARGGRRRTAPAPRRPRGAGRWSTLAAGAGSAA